MANFDCRNPDCMRCHPLRDHSPSGNRWYQGMTPGAWGTLYTAQDIAKIEADALRTAAEKIAKVWSGDFKPEVIADELREMADDKEGK